MNVIVGIDVGLTTGFAAIDAYGNIERTSSVPADLELLLQEVEDYSKGYEVEAFCIELPEDIPGPNQKIFREIGFMLEQELNEEIFYVRPGVWKGSVAYGHFAHDSVLKTKHEQDAAEIAYYLLLTKEAQG